MSGAFVEVAALRAGVVGSPTSEILHDLSFTITAGERVALVGPSGAGKTSLIRLLLGLNRPVQRLAGRIAFDGADVQAMSPAALQAFRQHLVAFVPQNPASALDPLKPLDWQWRQNLSTIADAAQRSVAGRQLAAFGVDARLTAYPCEWSRGMQQRLLIAMALARAPRLLIMDEPTSALDPVLAAEVMRTVLDQARARGTAILLVTHHAGLAAAMTDRHIRLEAGRIVRDNAGQGATPGLAPLAMRAGATLAGEGPPILKAAQVTVTLGGRRVIEDVFLTLRPGSALAIVGESGAGKSTLVRALLGLLPIAEGTITRSGRTPGYVSQDPLSALHPTMTCFDAIAEPLSARRVPAAEIRARVDAIATLLGLTALILQRGTQTLSVGQAQRACLARALVANPALVVFDEPLSALDQATAEEVVAAMERARARFGTAMIVVTHDLGFARRIADDIIVLRQGRIVEAAPAEAFFRAPRSAYGRTLCDAARTLGDLPVLAA